MSPAVGFRAWRIEEMLTGPRLASPVRNSAWPPRLALEANCTPDTEDGLLPPHISVPDLPPPLEGCTCGIYAYHDPEPMLAGLNAGVLGGSTLCWGRVVVHREGIRSQFARPLAFCYLDRSNASNATQAILEQLVVTYGVPLVDPTRIALYASEFGDSFKPESAPLTPWHDRLGRSARGIVERWLGV